MALRQLVTPRLWPEGTMATAEQMAAWLKICTDDERVWFCEQAQKNADDANLCWQGDHVATIDYWRRAHDYQRELCEQAHKALNAALTKD